MSKATELVPYAFKNGKKRIKTSQPMLDKKTGAPVIKNGQVMMQWENARTPDNKPIYDDSVILVTFIPEDGKVIPNTLSKAKMSKLINHAKDSGMDFIHQDASYSKTTEFEPQTELDSDDNTITTITVKYRPTFKSVCKPMASW